MVLIFIGTLFAANTLLTMFRWFPAYELRFLAAPAPELLAAVLVIVIARRAAPALSPWLTGVVSALASVYFLFGVGETFYQHIYRRSFVPQTDLALAPAFFEMITGWEGFRMAAVQAAGIALVVIATAGLFAVLFVLMGRAGARLRTPVFLVLAAALAVPLLAFGAGTPLTLRIAAQMQPPESIAGAAADASSGTDASAAAGKTTVAAPEPAATEPSFALPGLRDQDVHLFMIESYGRSVFENDIHWGRLADTYDETAAVLAASGYIMRSHYLEAVTFGGTSWLSDATLLTGVRVDSQKKYNEIITTDRRTVIDLFNEAGYRSVLSAPGMTTASEQWASFYRFDQFIFHDDFGYEGRYFTFGVMPDQFQLDVVRRRVLDRPGDTPQFIKYILVSSHTPWNYFPPYLEDWDRIGNGTVYDSTANTYYTNSWIMGNEYFEGYAHSIRYVLEVVRGYLADHVDGDDLVIITGDHQPKFPVSSKDATFSVPVHVLSRNAEAAAAFERFGYEPGLVPSQEPPHPPMEGFFDQLASVVRGERAAP